MAEALHKAAPANLKIHVSGGEELPAYQSPHNQASKLGLVVLQEWWGMNVSIQKTADEFASQGFRVVVPDLYRGKVAKDSEHAGHLLNGLDWGKAYKDIEAVAQYLKSNGCHKVGVTGFCMGGALTIFSTTLPEVDAAVCFYGVPDLSHLDLSKIHGPVQGHFGEQDQYKGFADPQTAHKLEKTLKDGGIHMELFMYPNSGHAFTNRDRPETYNENDSKIAKERAVEFFKKHLA